MTTFTTITLELDSEGVKTFEEMLNICMNRISRGDYTINEQERIFVVQRQIRIAIKNGKTKTVDIDKKIAIITT